MKYIHINDIQENKLKKYLVKEAMGDEFSFETLRSLPTFISRKKYCDMYLGYHVGKGSSRIVYQIDDNKVLKLAWNQKGIAQNREEFSFSQEWLVDVTPEVFNEMSDIENYTYITSEYVLPAKEKDFKEVFGINFRQFQTLVITVAGWYDYKLSRYHQTFTDEEINKISDFNIDICQFINYISNYQPPIGDMLRLINYGLVNREGKLMIVLLDSGLTEDIYNQYYKKKNMYENIAVHKGDKGKSMSTQKKWDDAIECPYCGEKAFFSMSISDGKRGRGRIKSFDADGNEMDSEVQTIGLYYCPKCYHFTALNNMA